MISKSFYIVASYVDNIISLLFQIKDLQFKFDQSNDRIKNQSGQLIENKTNKVENDSDFYFRHKKRKEFACSFNDCQNKTIRKKSLCSICQEILIRARTQRREHCPIKF